MAGNTKLVGFGVDGKVALERWGSRTFVQLPDIAVECLKEACYQHLPKHPPQEKSSWLTVRFNELSGNVEVHVGAEEGDLLVRILKLALAQEALGAATRAKLQSWLDGLEDALDARYKFFCTKDEPGVEGEDSAS